VLNASLTASSVAGQQPPSSAVVPEDSGVVISQTVRRVRVDVVVTDSQGQPVQGLKADDFHVLEDGKPQPLRQFDWHDGSNEQTPLPKLPELPANTFVNLPTAPERGPLTVLLYDMLNTPLGDQLNARARMAEFLRHNAGRRIAIFVLADRLRIVQGFTADTSLLARSLEAIKPTRTTLEADAMVINGPPATPGSSVPGPPAPPVSPTNGMGPGAQSGGRVDPMAALGQRFNQLTENDQAETQSSLLDQRVDNTLDAMAQIGRYLSGFEGRKNLIWYSGSFPASVFPDVLKQATAALKTPGLGAYPTDRNYTDRLRKATDLLTASEVAIYPVDARGLTGEAEDKLNPEIATMQLLAEQTGGRAYYNTNALTEALESAAVDGSTYYSLLYAPTNPKFDGKLRHIRVTLEKSGYTLAYRRTYLADDLESKNHHTSAAGASTAAAAAEPLPADEQFGAPLTHDLIFFARVDAIGSPLPPSPEQLAALRPYQEEMALAEHRKHPHSEKPQPMQQYAIVYSVLAELMGMPAGDDGAYHSDLAFSVLAYDEDGATLWGSSTRLEDTVQRARFEAIRRNGFRAVQTFFVPRNTAVLRLSVRDQHNGKSGSMEIRLPLAAHATAPTH
jgi:VWFA-related protein